MMELYPKVPANIKKRAVSAVRNFPKGCGFQVNPKPSFLPPPPPPPPPPSRSVEPEQISEAISSLKVTRLDDSNLSAEDKPQHEAPKDSDNLGAEARAATDRFDPTGDEGLKVNGHLEEDLGSLKNYELGVLDEKPRRSDDFEKLVSSSMKCENGGAEVLRSSENCVDGAAEERVNTSKRFLVIKRRNVSVIRQFPPGCGRGVPKIFSNGADSGSDPVASSESKVVSVEKKPESSGNNGAVSSLQASGVVVVKGSIVSELHERDADGKVTEETAAKSLEAKGSTVEKKIVEGDEVSKEDTVNSPKLKGLVSEKKKMVKAENLSAGGIKGEAERDGGNQTQMKAKEVNRRTAVTATKMKSSYGEKKLLVKQKAVVEGSVRVSSDAAVETEVQEINSKKIKEDARSPLRVHSRESMLEDHSEEKMLVRYSSKKTLEGEDAETDSVCKSLVVKPVAKKSIKGAMYVKPLKRKLPDEVGDESLEAYGEKLVVQALVSAEHCPWRKGKKSAGLISHSITPKVKVKKERKLSGSRSASVPRITYSSQHKNSGDMEEEDDSLSQDGGNGKTLTMYKGFRELSITMTPSVPSEPFCEGSSSEDAFNRKRVKKALRLFQLVSRKLLQGEEAKSKDQGKLQRVDLEAARILKQSNEWLHLGETFIGHVPGVEVGDEFHYRVELSIVGIHRPFQGGIDFTKNKEGVVLATSIVASGGYPDDIDSSDVLIYSGSGDTQAGDQKLERGNLALKNSIDALSPVRVVYGSKELIKGDSRDAKAKLVSTFTYDGLYQVEKYWLEKGPNNYNVFKFQLRKMPGQPEIALKELKRTKISKVREGLCVKDISGGKESMPICAVNTVDDSKPPPFKYITRVMYPSTGTHNRPRGCDCTDGCSDSERCACAVKNGGEIPFNFNGAIVQAKALVFECGPSCKCPPSCHNRVSQHGIKLPLEIFKTKTRGWGVRSLYSIPSGTFICEYIGEMLQETQAEERVNDEYLFDIGHNYDDPALWDGLPSIIPGMQSSAACGTVEDVGFTIDAAEYGNVGRFINHSCSPNLYAQNVLYDHDDKRMPHIMFFAIDNIPPLQELTYHYNYTLDQVRDSEGNIKKKECYCGSAECTGRLY